MKKILLIIGIMLLFLGMTTRTFSQGGFYVSAGLSLPSGDFADDDAEDITDGDAAGAGTGYGVTLKYLHPLNSEGLFFYGSLTVNYNGLSDDVKDDLDEDFGEDADVTYLKYINVPVSGGIHYNFPMDGNITVFGNAGLTFNYLKITPLEAEHKELNASMEVDLDPSTSIGLKIGGGILLNDKITIEINYLALGEHDIDGEMTAKQEGYDSYSEDIDLEKKVDIVSLTVGLLF